MNRSYGIVKWFDDKKGYGFLLNEAEEEVFVHYRAILIEGYKTLKAGQEVTFLQVNAEKGWQAAEVEHYEGILNPA